MPFLSTSHKIFFVDTEKIILKFIWKGKGTRLGKTILQKSKMEEASLLSFTTYYTGRVIKTMWFFKPLGKPSAAQWDLLGPRISLARLPAPRRCGTAASPSQSWERLQAGQTGCVNDPTCITSSYTRSGLW